MNARSRVYAAIIAARFLLTAMLLALDPDRYARAASFEALFGTLTPSWWALILAAVGVGATVVVFTGRAVLCRVVTVGAVFVSWAWATAFIIGAATDVRASWILAVTFGGFAAKDLTFAGAPYTAPLEVLPDDMPVLPEQLA